MNEKELIEKAVSISGNPRLREFMDPSSKIYNPSYMRIIRKIVDDANPKQFPTPLKQAGNLVKSAVKFVKSGGKVVSREEHDRREAICLACPRISFEAKGVIPPPRCSLCGCNARAKPWGYAEVCPDNPPRWGGEDDANSIDKN